MMDKFKIRIRPQVLNIHQIARIQTIHRNYIITFIYKTILQLRP
jgi:hypothetical protein